MMDASIQKSQHHKNYKNQHSSTLHNSRMIISYALLLSWIVTSALLLAPSSYAFQPSSSGVRNCLRPRIRIPTLSTSNLEGPDECALDADGEALNECLLSEGYVNDNEDELIVTKIYKARVESLRGRFESSNTPNSRVEFTKPMPPPVFSNNTYFTSPPKIQNSHVFDLHYSTLMTDDDIVLADCVRRPNMQPVSRAFVRAGPRATLHFDPPMVNAAIVTCGGLCPGLNNVIRELTHTLYYIYGVNQVWGVRGGYHGFHDDKEDDDDYHPVLLTPEKVEDIHHEGGTVLRSSRGGFDIDKILAFLAKRNIQQLYVIGGDGTHRGAYAIHQACMEHNLNVAVAGIPKTIGESLVIASPFWSIRPMSYILSHY
jgi:6-phosphofructokinase 1